MAGLAAAGIQSGAAALWYRIRSGPWWTGTLGSLVLRQTDSVDTTGVLGADIHTGEAQAVTELAGRTVGVGEAAHSSAANHGVGGISFELAWRTGTAR